MKDPILAAYNADLVRDTLKSAGLRFEDSNIPSMSDTDVNSLGSALSVATMSNIQSQVCTSIPFMPNNCGISDLA